MRLRWLIEWFAVIGCAVAVLPTESAMKVIIKSKLGSFAANRTADGIDVDISRNGADERSLRGSRDSRFMDSLLKAKEHKYLSLNKMMSKFINAEEKARNARKSEDLDKKRIFLKGNLWDESFPRRNRDLLLQAKLNDQLDGYNWMEQNTTFPEVSSGQLPLNDDIADFAAYLKEKKEKEKDKKFLSPILASNSKYDEKLDMNSLIGFKDDVLLLGEDSSAGHAGIAEKNEGIWGSPIRKTKNGTEWGKQKSDKRLHSVWNKERESAYGNSAKEESVTEAEEQSPESEEATESGEATDAPGEDAGLQIGVAAGGQALQQATSLQEAKEDSARPRFVKDKYVQLPEPLLYNDSHVVSSLLYSMIPFRSPLLSLLDPDKHAKYIMIKVDPVLAPATDIHFPKDEMTFQESKLEQNLIDLIDKSINNELASAYNPEPISLQHGGQINSKIKNKMMKIPELAKIMNDYQSQKVKATNLTPGKDIKS